MVLDLHEQIIRKALALGFHAAGFTYPRHLESHKKQFEKFFSEKRHASMVYLERNKDLLINPFLIFPEVKSILVCLMGYAPTEIQNPDCKFKVSRYAYGKDYHSVIREKLIKVSDFIKEKIPGTKTMIFIDSGKVPEKIWAINAGLGWRGKNTLVLNRTLGSYFFIGVLMTDLQMNFQENIEENRCGTCKKCIDACPAGALAEFKIDARKCISYHTIENKDEFPLNFQVHGWIYGCDICQEVCPWNKGIQQPSANEFKILPFIRQSSDQDWLNLNEENFNSIFAHSAIKRIKFSRLTRNILKALNK